MQFQRQELYGGAIETAIPVGMLDISTIRQVPDTQEVFVNLNNDELSKEDSLIFDLLESVPGTQAEAVSVHIEEVSKLDNSEFTLLKTQNVASGVPNAESCITVAKAPIAHKWGREEKRYLVLIFGLIRYKEMDTDVVVSVYMPGDKDEQHTQESEDNKIARGTEIVAQAMLNYKVLNKNLFG